MSDGTKTIMLWGDTQVGKTALLTMALDQAKQDELPLDRAKSALAVNILLNTHKRRLLLNQQVLPTSEDFIDLDLISKNGSIIQIRDMKGELTQISKESTYNKLMASDAILFVMELNPPNLSRNILAIKSAWDICLDKPKGLAFTKCERSLAPNDPAWTGRRDWWRKVYQWGEHEPVISGFGEAVWPTSAYGYEAKFGFPAVVLGEFGQLLPYRINSKGVIEPFRWLLSQLGVK